MDDNTATLHNTVWEHYRQKGRHDLPWRQSDPDGVFDPYRIAVSELMLQQTQVSRVVPKFIAFIEAFPSFDNLAVAPLSDVLMLWSGLGYNRRAKFLHQTARLVAEQHGGTLPNQLPELVALPGIGTNTAGAIIAYSYNEPVVFIETNVRTVFIHHFFAGQDKVTDKALLPVVEKSLPPNRTREWYWALMDYGTHLKQTVGNVSRASASYMKQSQFHGSRRQIRGKLLRLLALRPFTVYEIQSEINDERLEGVLVDLQKEGFIAYNGSSYQLRA